MKPDNIILEKSYNFSLRITSIGANVEESVGAQSKSDFIHKFGIAYKESRETSFWLRLFKDANIIEEKLSKSFLSDSEELKKILASILKTSKGIKMA